jgi:hypothetical protein
MAAASLARSFHLSALRLPPPPPLLLLFLRVKPHLQCSKVLTLLIFSFFRRRETSQLVRL